MLALTPGEPAGIGPDLVVELAQTHRDFAWVAVGSATVLATRAHQLGLSLRIESDLCQPSCEAGVLTVLDVPLPAEAQAGVLCADNAPAVIDALQLALEAVLDGRFSGLVTGPMQKSVINDAGIVFTGHTEYLWHGSGVDDVVMLLADGNLRVALATTHLPLREVADALSAPLLRRRLKILADELKTRFGIAQPRIGVSGLNPHAGEGGYLGREEIDVIEPVCAELAGEGLAITGPLPADTLFTTAQLARFDAVMVMYHDQGLPVLKYASFGNAVNVTLGLPFVRTSVDHGTALDVAGTGAADAGSLRAALELAFELTR